MPNKDKNWQAFQTGLPALPKHLFENQQPPREKGRTLSQIFLAMKAATTQADHPTETQDEAANEIANWRGEERVSKPVLPSKPKPSGSCGCTSNQSQPVALTQAHTPMLPKDVKMRIRRRLRDAR